MERMGPSICTQAARPFSTAARPSSSAAVRSLSVVHASCICGGGGESAADIVWQRLVLCSLWGQDGFLEFFRSPLTPRGQSLAIAGSPLARILPTSS